MKKFVINLVASVTITLYGINALAKEISSHIFGLDIFKSNFSFQKIYGKDVFKENLNRYHLFGQYSLPNFFFLEYGYGYMQGKFINTLVAGDFYPGHVIPLSLSLTFRSKITQKYPYIGIGYNYYLSKLSNNSYISLLGGLNLVKVNGWFEIIANRIIGVMPSAQIANSKRSFNKTSSSVMLKAAINHKFNDHFGVRLIGMWQKLNHFKLNSNPNGAQIRLKNCTSIGLGLFYNI